MGFIVSQALDVALDRVKLEIYSRALPGKEPAGKLLEDTKSTIQRVIAERHKQFEVDIDKLKEETIAQAREFPPAVLEIFDATLPPEDRIPELIPRGCHWADVECCIRERIRASIRKAYGDERRRMRAKLQQNVEKISVATERKAEEVRSQTKLSIAEAVRRVDLSVDRSFETFGNVVLAVAYLLWFVLAYSVIKSFGVMLSRVTFNTWAASADCSRIISFGKSEDCHALSKDAPDVEIVPAPLKLNLDPATTVYGSRSKTKFATAGYAWNWAAPKLLQCTVSRALNSFLVLNRIGEHARRRAPDGSYWPFEVTGPPGASSVVWRLKEDEEVFFRMSSAVAMSESISLRTEVSFRFATLCLGQSIYNYARGPGLLILLCYGGKIAMEPDRSAPVDPARLLAWNRSASFTLTANISFKSAYLDPAVISFDGRGAAIVDAMPPDSKAFGSSGGLARFLKSFILPW